MSQNTCILIQYECELILMKMIHQFHLIRFVSINCCFFALDMCVNHRSIQLSHASTGLYLLENIHTHLKAHTHTEWTVRVSKS